MADTYWLKQADEPLFPDLIWSRPENKHARGKLLIIGGSRNSFAAVSASYNAAMKAGIGTCRALLPETLQKSLGKILPEASFAPSNSSGGFANSALSSLLDEASWADGVLLAGGFGNNSETTLVVEAFIDKYPGPLMIAGDTPLGAAQQRQRTLLTSGTTRLQKLAAGQGIALATSSSLVQLVEQLHSWSDSIQLGLVTNHQGYLLVAYRGRISSTACAAADLISVAAYAAVWQLQQPTKPFEAATSAVLICSQA